MAEHGLMIYSDPGADRPLLELATQQCVHCGGQWVAKPKRLISEMLSTAEAMRREDEGRKTRGWCMNCSGPICGPGCAECVPTDLYLSNLEAGRPADFKPVRGFVPHNFE